MTNLLAVAAGMIYAISPEKNTCFSACFRVPNTATLLDSKYFAIKVQRSLGSAVRMRPLFKLHSNLPPMVTQLLRALTLTIAHYLL